MGNLLANILKKKKDFTGCCGEEEDFAGHRVKHFDFTRCFVVFRTGDFTICFVNTNYFTVWCSKQFDFTCRFLNCDYFDRCSWKLMGTL